MPESAFASTVQSPEAKSLHDAEASAFSSFSTRDALGIVDTGATKTVIGSGFVANLLAALRPEVRRQVQRCRCSVVFRFGNQGTLESKHALVVPIGPLKLNIVPGQTPFLLSNTLLRAIGATVDVTGEVIKSTLLKRHIPIQLNAKGLFLVDLNDLITPTSRDAEVEPAETFANLNCKSLPSVSVQKPGHAQSEAKTMMTQKYQVNTGLVTRRIQQFEAMKPEPIKNQVNTREPNDRPISHSDDSVPFESVPGETQPGVIRFGFKTGCVLSHTCDRPVRSPVPRPCHADLRSRQPECPPVEGHGGGAKGRSPSTNWKHSSFCHWTRWGRPRSISVLPTWVAASRRCGKRRAST